MPLAGEAEAPSEVVNVGARLIRPLPHSTSATTVILDALIVAGPVRPSIVKVSISFSLLSVTAGSSSQEKKAVNNPRKDKVNKVYNVVFKNSNFQLIFYSHYLFLLYFLITVFF